MLKHRVAADMTLFEPGLAAASREASDFSPELAISGGSGFQRSKSSLGLKGIEKA